MRKIFVMVLLLASAGIARADTFSSFSALGVACDIYPNDGICNSSTTTAPSLTVVAPDGLISVTAEVQQLTLSYGSLSLTAIAGGSMGTVTPSYSTIDATIGFSDMVTIFGGTGLGQLSYTAQTVGYIDNENGRCSGHFGSSASVPTTFTFGVPFQIGAQVSASPYGFICTTTITSAFTLTGLSVTDANGTPLTGYSFTDASQTDYPFLNGTFVPTPEASTGVLLAAGALLGLLLVRARTSA
jgi:hypothetical protein